MLISRDFLEQKFIKYLYRWLFKHSSHACRYEQT